MSDAKDSSFGPNPQGRLMLLVVSANTTDVPIHCLIASKSIL